MKKVLLVTFSILLISLAIAGCKGKKSKNTENITTTKVIKKTSFEFKTSGGIIKVNMTAADALKIAGKYKDYVEVPSCAFEGYDKIYIYPGFEINVNTIDGIDQVTRITLTDDSVTTKEGLYIGDSIQKMKGLYGTKYVLEDGIYEYTMGESKLSIGVKDDEVVSIRYY